MKERYMIVQIVRPLAYNTTDEGGYTIFSNCYEIEDKDYECAASACTAKDRLKKPEHYIVVQYWL